MTADDPRPNADAGGARVPPGVVTVPSAVGVDELLRRVVARVQERGLDIFTVIDHSGEADEVGLAFARHQGRHVRQPEGGDADHARTPAPSRSTCP